MQDEYIGSLRGTLPVVPRQTFTPANKHPRRRPVVTALATLLCTVTALAVLAVLQVAGILAALWVITWMPLLG